MINRINDLVKSLGKTTALLIGVGALVVSAMIIFLLFNKGPEYNVLYSHLSPEDSGAVIEKLKEMKVAYAVNGTTISVPTDKVHETRMELAGEGLPQGGGVGFEIFDKTSFGVTDFVQKVNYKRALQGELARTISQIKEVEAARVHLALPEKGVFLDEQKKARASIILKLKPGKTLSQGQVSAIVHLAANSFDNLRPEDVAVVDTTGKMWTKGSEEESAMHLSASELEYKRSLERDLETRVQTMIEKAVGPNKVVARVSAEVDNKRIERTEETYNPDGQVVRSEHRNKENSVGGVAALGVPGVLSNLPEAAQGQARAEGSPAQSNRSDEVINYEISKVTSHVIEPVGTVKRLTVAVLVDGNYEVAKDAAGKETRKYNARTDDEIAKFTDMIKGAVGFSQDRGDSISVVSTPFESEFTEVEPEKPSVAQVYIMPMMPLIIKYASVAVIAVFLILFIIRPLVKRATVEKAALEAIQRSLPQGLAKGLGPGGEHALESGEDMESMGRLKDIVRNNPQQVAMVLKGWIKERQ
ncbi:MAG: flagellar M-ring protein FliF [Deltaproteobacteria bacterium GWC2_56_8]|nr:MAG: flagellar M-ring protein FliF [Deltaproteobacteria bacterium GWB2_55_19]OGP33668.1 MAG: flagellar M-ring protein FliF [Deltaproteobacteria bacterium GWC2_56_8]HAO93678.1 flagellar M-ring protein FliF [Deltaproteobacteria bacterium]